MTTTTSQLDDVNLRLVQTFGAAPQRAGGAVGGGWRRRPRRTGRRRAGVSNLNVGLHYRHADNSSANPFPSLGGTRR